MKGYIDSLRRNIISGWVWDPERPTAKIKARFVFGGSSTAFVVANLYREDLQVAGIGDGSHGIRITLSVEQLAQLGEEVILEAVDISENLVVIDRKKVNRGIEGRFERFSAGFCDGWAWDNSCPERKLKIYALFRGSKISSAIADRMRGDLLKAGVGNGAHGFQIKIPGEVLRVIKPGERVTLEVDTGQIIGTLDIPAEHNLIALNEAVGTSEINQDSICIIDRRGQIITYNPTTIGLLQLNEDLVVNDSGRHRAYEPSGQEIAIESYQKRTATILHRTLLEDENFESTLQLGSENKQRDAAYRDNLASRCRYLLKLKRPFEVIRLVRIALDLSEFDSDIHQIISEAYIQIGGHALAKRYSELAPINNDIVEFDQESLDSIVQHEIKEFPYNQLHNGDVAIEGIISSWSYKITGDISTVKEVAPAILLGPRRRGCSVNFQVLNSEVIYSNALPSYALFLYGCGSGAVLYCRLREETIHLLQYEVRFQLEVRSADGKQSELVVDLVRMNPLKSLGEPLLKCLAIDRWRLHPFIAGNVDPLIGGGTGIWLRVQTAANSAVALRIPRMVAHDMGAGL